MLLLTILTTYLCKIVNPTATEGCNLADKIREWKGKLRSLRRSKVSGWYLIEYTIN